MKEYLSYIDAQEYTVEKYLYAVCNVDESDLIKLMTAESHDLKPGKDDSVIEVYKRVLPLMPETEEDIKMYFKYLPGPSVKYFPLTFLRDVAAEFGSSESVVVKQGAKVLPGFALNWPDGDPEADVIVDASLLELTPDGWIYNPSKEE